MEIEENFEAKTKSESFKLNKGEFSYNQLGDLKRKNHIEKGIRMNNRKKGYQESCSEDQLYFQILTGKSEMSFELNLIYSEWKTFKSEDNERTTVRFYEGKRVEGYYQGFEFFKKPVLEPFFNCAILHYDLQDQTKVKILVSNTTIICQTNTNGQLYT